MTIIKKIQRQLRLERCITAIFVIITASFSLLMIVNRFFNVSGVALGSLTVLIVGALALIYYRAGSFSLPPAATVTRFLDRNYPMFEDSSGLFLQKNLNTLEQLQLQRISDNVASDKEAIKLPRKRQFRSVLLASLLLSISVLMISLPHDAYNTAMVSGNSSSPVDEQLFASDEPSIPSISSIQISIEPPAYTGLPDNVITTGSVTAIASSKLSWNVHIDGEVDQAALVFNDRDQAELLPDGDGETYSTSIVGKNRLIYRIKASSADTTIYSSYYSIDVMEDRPPQFRISSPDQFQTLLTETNREIEMSVEIRDDHGVMEAGLNATLARGSGESVRFREQSMAIDQLDGIGTNRVTASILLHADSLQLTPGDELYLQATATDNHPDAQTGRSETYMIVLEDTTRSQPLLAGNIQIDLMPEDFRSQRQIIVDTEELIEEKDRVDDEQFRTRSRRIGRDQEMLMLEFGQYLGMEEESVLVSGVMNDGAVDDDHGHSHGHEHEHGDEGGGTDAEPELDGEGQETTRSTSASMIPDEFFHDHGSPEMNTLFAESPRALLTRALNEMFQASQYLLMDQPEEALAFEYRALEFLQQAQQADRRYVRRAGLDGIPIPVDEDRLTGDVDDFAAPRQQYLSAQVVPPLLRIEQQLRMGELPSGQALTEANDAIRQAEISESDKLFLLNRLDRLDDPLRSPEAREQMLMKLSEIHSARPRNPAPLRIPLFKKTSGSR